jgi:hypothetical protein
VKETPLIEKVPPKVTTDKKQEEIKLEKDEVSTLQEKKPPPEEKPLSEEKMLALEGKKPSHEEKKPIPKDKTLPPEEKTLALEEEHHEIPKTQAQIADEKPKSRVAPKAEQEEKQPQTKMGDLHKEEAKTTKKMKEQLQTAGIAKPDQMEPGKEKTVSFLFLTFQSCMQCTSLHSFIAQG